MEGGGWGWGCGLGQADITRREQEARLTSVPRLSCSVDAVPGRGPGQVPCDGQVERILLPLAILVCLFFVFF